MRCRITGRPASRRGVAAMVLMIALAVWVHAAGQSEDAGDPAAASGFNATGFPIVNEPMEFTIIHKINTGTRPPAEMPHFQALSEQTNVNIEWMSIPNANWNERKNLMIASGDLPDAMFGEGLSDTDILNNRPLFVQLEELIDEYNPKLQMIFEAEPVTRKISIAPDGHIYSLPQIRPFFPDTPQAAGINKTWLDRLGLDMPQTTEEFYDVLWAFKNEDPNGNGVKDEIPFTFSISGTTTGWAPFFGSFGILDYSSPKTPLSEHVNVQDGEVVFVPADPRYMEAIQYFRRLYADGLIDREVFTQDGSQRRAKETSPDNLVGVTINWTVRGGPGTQRSDEFVQLLPLAGPRGDQLWIKNNSGRIQKNMFSIFSGNESPEVLMRWVDEFYDQEFAPQVFFGPLGINMAWTDGGKLEVLEAPEGMSAGEFKWANTTSDMSPLAVLPETEEMMIPNSEVLVKWEHHEALEPYLPEEIYPNLWYSQEEAEELTVLLIDIESYVEQKQAEWVMQGGIEDDWDDYLNRLDRMGLSRLREIYTDAYTRFVNS